jgi:hypothetical protein
MSEKESRKNNSVRRPNAEHSRDRGRPGRVPDCFNALASPPCQGLASLDDRGRSPDQDYYSGMRMNHRRFAESRWFKMC